MKQLQKHRAEGLVLWGQILAHKALDYGVYVYMYFYNCIDICMYRDSYILKKSISLQRSISHVVYYAASVFVRLLSLVLFRLCYRHLIYCVIFIALCIVLASRIRLGSVAVSDRICKR